MEEEGVKEKGPPQDGKVPKGVQVPPRVDQVPIVGEGNDVLMVPIDMTNGDIRESLLSLARSIITHVNRVVEPRVNAFESTMTSRLIDFVRMNPPIFLGSMVG